MNELIPIAQVQVMAKTVAQSGLFGLKNQDQAMTLMLLAQSENIHPMTALQQYHIINGRPVLKSTEMLSRFQNSGGKIKYIKSDDKECEIEFTHEMGGTMTIKWDIAKAKTAGVYESNPVWKKYPENMLRSRCITDGIKAIYPSCLGGFMSDVEAQDLPKEEVEVVEVIETIQVDNNYKELLTIRLRKLDFTNAMIKEFATKYDLANNVELLQELATENDKFMKLIEEFEDDNK
jgi:hypothetical protein